MSTTCARGLTERIAYDWKSLPAKALVVDVGGGVGSASLALAKEFPDLRFVVQDRQPAIANGIEVWIQFAKRHGRVVTHYA